MSAANEVQVYVAREARRLARELRSLLEPHLGPAPLPLMRQVVAVALEVVATELLSTWTGTPRLSKRLRQEIGALATSIAASELAQPKVIHPQPQKGLTNGIE